MGNTAIEKIYDTVNEVLGGTDQEEMLCMMLPGTVLDKESYVYNTKFEKPIKVAANESRLANKLFNVSRVVGSDNGRQLSNQFLAALNVLTPKINNALMEAKEQLRDMLKMPAEYKLEDGTAVKGTLQEAFYYLYGLYVNERKIWAEKQSEKRAELEAKYPGKSEEAHMQRQEEFLNWYQTIAESYLLNIQVKRGKVLAIFSPNDMKIIEGILSSGSGAELEEAREMVENARKFDPDGGYVYPVTLQPADWFESLESNMGFIDLLETSDAYALKYSNLQKKRRAITRKIGMFETSNKNKELAETIEALKNAEKEMAEAENDLNSMYADGAALVVNGIIDILPDTDPTNILQAFAERLDFKKLLKEGMVSKFADAYKTSSASTDKYVNVSRKLVEKSRELIANKSSDYTYELKSSYEQLDIINEEIEDVKAKMKMALAKESSGEGMVENLFPDSYEKRFMEVLIQTNSSELSEGSFESSEAASTSGGVNFLFGGVKIESGSSKSFSAEELAEAEMSISIGFLATKVSIVRNWFNPGVLMLSKDMYSSSSVKISDGTKEEVNRKENLFPCYPTAFIIAKDITIHFESSNEKSQSLKTAIEEHAAGGGGFFGFSAKRATSSSSSSNKTHSTSDAKGITIKIPGSQILGYYLQIVPKDNSISMSNENAADVSIFEFVSRYKEVLNEEM